MTRPTPSRQSMFTVRRHNRSRKCGEQHGDRFWHLTRVITVTSPAGPATTTIAAGPLLTVSKVGNLVETNGNTTDSRAEVNDIITYTYTVVNTGNVAITGIVINDTHELALVPQASFSEGGLIDGPLAPGTVSSDAGVNGSYDLLQPGASITFTYVHTVTQAEVDGG